MQSNAYKICSYRIFEVDIRQKHSKKRRVVRHFPLLAARPPSFVNPCATVFQPPLHSCGLWQSYMYFPPYLHSSLKHLYSKDGRNQRQGRAPNKVRKMLPSGMLPPHEALSRPCDWYGWTLLLFDPSNWWVLCWNILKRTDYVHQGRNDCSACSLSSASQRILCCHSLQLQHVNRYKYNNAITLKLRFGHVFCLKPNFFWKE